MAVAKASNKNQTFIPGTERPDAIEELDEAARNWRDALADLEEAKNAADAAKAECHALMKENKLPKYIAEDGEWVRVLTYETKGQIKMRKPKKDEADE
jgi:hypothetical protein